MLLHPPEDAPCVLRGDYLECAMQVNRQGERPWHLLKEANELLEELSRFQSQPDLQRSLSWQVSEIPRSLSGELSEAQSIFGQVLQPLGAIDHVIVYIIYRIICYLALLLGIFALLYMI